MPKVIQVQLPEGVADSRKANGQRLPAMLDPEHAFMAAWVNCRRRHEVTRELRDQRVQFLVRMASA
jgi:hypothetical protein